MNETKRLKQELEKYSDKSDQFRQQLQEFEEFKEKLVKAGVYSEDSFTIPLMHRLGHVHTVFDQAKKAGVS